MPQEDRQTLLFSATQTRSVKDLARLSLEKPIYVSVHENSDKATPDKLCEKYMRIELHDKINLLWSFIKSHKRQKLLVFSILGAEDLVFCSPGTENIVVLMVQGQKTLVFSCLGTENIDL